MSQKSAKRRRKLERQRGRLESPQPSPDHTEPGTAIRDLEELLKSGDIDGYAQTCWNLANDLAEPPEPGQIINLSGECEEHGTHDYTFLLTLQSMMTITQCLGMRTCDEAVRLVASKLPPEKLPCYRLGHSEQFQDWAIFGIEPGECRYCGELPNFQGAAKSINWTNDIPVKGIDGQEYQACPNCGSELLELIGEQMDQWGWKILCLDCRWEIKQAELLDIKQYCGVMEQTKRDLSDAAELMGNTSVSLETRIQTVGVKTRMLLENIGYAALVSNKDSSGKTREEMKDLRSPRDIFRDLEKVHPNFFPTPIEINRSRENQERPFRKKTEGVLTKEQAVQIYRELNFLAHSRNPLDEPLDYDRYQKMIPQWLNLISNTLEMHQVMLFHHPDHFYVVKMCGDRDGTVQCTTFTRDTTGAATCAWPDCVSSIGRHHCEFWGRPWSECSLPDREPAQTEGKLLGAEVDAQEAAEQMAYLLGIDRVTDYRMPG